MYNRQAIERERKVVAYTYMSEPTARTENYSKYVANNIEFVTNILNRIQNFILK